MAARSRWKAPKGRGARSISRSQSTARLLKLRAPFKPKKGTTKTDVRPAPALQRDHTKVGGTRAVDLPCSRTPHKTGRDGGCSSPLLAQRAHQTNEMFRQAVVVEARSRRRISLHPWRETSKLGWTISRAVLLWEKGASRVIDCKAIGGSGGWKKIDQGWAGEKRCAQWEINQPSSPRRQTSKLGGIIGTTSVVPAPSRKSQVGHPSW
jgi:hypothetical protein